MKLGTAEKEEEVVNDDTPCCKCHKYDHPEWVSIIMQIRIKPRCMETMMPGNLRCLRLIMPRILMFISLTDPAV